jgi:hypothetical protein
MLPPFDGAVCSKNLQSINSASPVLGVALVFEVRVSEHCPYTVIVRSGCVQRRGDLTINQRLRIG